MKSTDHVLCSSEPAASPSHEENHGRQCSPLEPTTSLRSSPSRPISTSPVDISSREGSSTLPFQPININVPSSVPHPILETSHPSSCNSPQRTGRLEESRTKNIPKASDATLPSTKKTTCKPRSQSNARPAVRVCAVVRITNSKGEQKIVRKQVVRESTLHACVIDQDQEP